MENAKIKNGAVNGKNKVKNVVLLNNNFFDLEAIKLLNLKKFFKSEIPGLISEIVYSSPDHSDKIIFNYFTGHKWDPMITIISGETEIELFPKLVDPYKDPILDKIFLKIGEATVDGQDVLNILFNEEDQKIDQLKVPFGNGQNIILRFKKSAFAQVLAWAKWVFV